MNEPRENPGRIDLHCHILPGIDDGCRTLEQSLSVVRSWKAEGFIGSVCTPHVATTWYPDNTPTTIAAAVRELRRDLHEAGLDYTLWTGAEVRLSARVVDWMKRHGVPTLADSRAVLIDYWGGDWHTCCDDAVDWLLEQEYVPVLAHPERMGLDAVTLGPILDRLTAKGVLLQGNLNSLSGGEGKSAQALADDLVARGRYHVLASDTHEPPSVAGRVAGLRRTAEEFGDETLDKLLSNRARELLFGEHPSPRVG